MNFHLHPSGFEPLPSIVFLIKRFFHNKIILESFKFVPFILYCRNSFLEVLAQRIPPNPWINFYRYYCNYL